MTDGGTDGPTDGSTDGPTKRGVESRSTRLKIRNGHDRFKFKRLRLPSEQRHDIEDEWTGKMTDRQRVRFD